MKNKKLSLHVHLTFTYCYGYIKLLLAQIEKKKIVTVAKLWVEIWPFLCLEEASVGWSTFLSRIQQQFISVSWHPYCLGTPTSRCSSTWNSSLHVLILYERVSSCSLGSTGFIIFTGLGYLSISFYCALESFSKYANPLCCSRCSETSPRQLKSFWKLKASVGRANKRTSAYMIHNC